MRGWFTRIGAVWLGGLLALGMRAEEARLLRFPALHGGRVVFTYAGDLYTVGLSGGVARRLTSDPKGFEKIGRAHV